MTEALCAADVPGKVILVRSVLTGLDYDSTVTEARFDCQGWRDALVVDTATNVRNGETKLYVLCASLRGVVPLPTDRLLHGGVVYTIASVDVDAAGCAWVCTCRD